MISCPKCGAPNPKTRTQCYICHTTLAVPVAAATKETAAGCLRTASDDAMPLWPMHLRNCVNTRLPLHTLAVLTLAMIIEVVFVNTRTFEYNVISFISSGSQYRQILLTLDQNELVRLGRHGWELVGVVEDVQTSFRNLGDEAYLATINSNVHTGAALCCSSEHPVCSCFESVAVG